MTYENVTLYKIQSANNLPFMLIIFVISMVDLIGIDA